MCGSRRIRRKVITVEYGDGVRVPDVTAEVCSACGEIYFDVPAMEKLEEFDAKHGRSRSPRRGR
jgi:YgiT-type zinc finger domain-containing protein